MNLEALEAQFGSKVEHSELLPLAFKIYSEAMTDAQEDNYSLDINTIIIIVTLLYKIGKIIWEWYNKDMEESIKKSKRLSWWQRIVIWSVVARKAPLTERVYLYDGILSMIYKFTNDERKIWFECVKS